MSRALVASASLAALGALAAWLVAIAAASSTPPPSVRFFGEPRAGESWVRVAAFDGAHRKIVPVSGVVGYGGRWTTLDQEHANVTVGPGRTPIEARLQLGVGEDARELELRIDSEITQDCEENELRYASWRAVVMGGPDGPPLYPEGGLASSTRSTRALILEETPRTITIPPNAAGARLDDGRLLRPGRGELPLEVAHTGAGWTVSLDAPAFFEVRRDGCVREMRFTDTIEVAPRGERWTSVHVFGSRFAPEGTSVFFPPAGDPRVIAGELLAGPGAGDPLLGALAGGALGGDALPFALARLSWARTRAPRIGPDDAAQRATWRAAQAGTVSAARWIMRALALLGALLLAVWALRGARQPGEGQGRSIAIGVFLLVVALAALGALDWSIVLSAK